MVRFLLYPPPPLSVPKTTQRRTYKTPTRAAKPEVNRILRKLRNLGLQLEFSYGSGHWRVIDPGTGAFLTTVSNTPSDRNWWKHIRRAVEKAGFKWDGQPRKKLRRTKGGETVAAVDLEALAYAQRMARIHGEREPQIDDLDNKDVLNQMRRGYNEQETEEAISNMAQGVESARAHRIISRLLYMAEQKGTEMSERARERNPRIKDGGVAHEIAFVAQQVAAKRGLRYWKSHDSAMTSINNFLSGTTRGMAIWTANLLEATMDELDGLRYDPPAAAQPAQERKTHPQHGTPVVSRAEAMEMISDVLTGEWVLGSEIRATLVPEHLSAHSYEKALQQLFRDGAVDRMREQKKQGGMLYRIQPAAAVAEPAPEPEPEPLPEPEPEPTPEPEFEPTHTAIGEGDIDEPGDPLGPPPYEVPEPARSLREAIAGATIAERYAEIMFEKLRDFSPNGEGDWRNIEPILTRLDKLAGISGDE